MHLLLDRPDRREATVMRLRFGLGDEGPKTLKEIGERLGLTRKHIRQIKGEALCKLRECLEAARARQPSTALPAIQKSKPSFKRSRVRTHFASTRTTSWMPMNPHAAVLSSTISRVTTSPRSGLTSH